MIKNIMKFRYFLLIFSLVIGLGLFCSNSAFAITKIGFVDMEKAVVGTKEFKRGIANFNREFQKEKSVIAAREEKIKKMLEQINKQGFVLTPELKKKKEESFLLEKKKFERYVQDRNEEFEKKRQDMMNKILEKMLKVLKVMGKQKKMTMVLEKKALFYSDDALDLTSQAIIAYNKKHK